MLSFIRISFLPFLFNLFFLLGLPLFSPSSLMSSPPPSPSSYVGIFLSLPSLQISVNRSLWYLVYETWRLITGTFCETLWTRGAPDSFLLIFCHHVWSLAFVSFVFMLCTYKRIDVTSDGDVLFVGAQTRDISCLPAKYLKVWKPDFKEICSTMKPN